MVDARVVHRGFGTGAVGTALNIRQRQGNQVTPRAAREGDPLDTDGDVLLPFLLVVAAFDIFALDVDRKGHGRREAREGILERVEVTGSVGGTDIVGAEIGVPVTILGNSPAKMRWV